MEQKTLAFYDSQRAVTAAGYETEAQFFTRRWDVNAQNGYIRDRALAFREDSPRIQEAADRIGSYNVRLWLQKHIADFGLFCGNGAHVNEQQAAAIADSIMNRYPAMKASEVCLFFAMLKSGDIEMRSSILDGRNIMQALKNFTGKVRGDILAADERRGKSDSTDGGRAGLLGLRDFNIQMRAEGLRPNTPGCTVREELLDLTDDEFLEYARTNRVTEGGVW